MLIPLAAALGASALAPAYAAVEARLGLVFAGVALAFAYGLCSGALSAWAVEASHARSPGLAAALSALGGAAGFWLAFSAWAGILYGRGAGATPPEGALAALGEGLGQALRLAARPGEAAGLVLGAETSPWRFMGLEATGSYAATAWAVQWAAFSAGVCLVAARRASRPYSEEGEVWLEPLRLGMRRFAVPGPASGAAEALGERFRRGDLGYFLEAPEARPGEAFLELSLLARDRAPGAVATVTLSGAGVPFRRRVGLARNVAAPRDVAERIAARAPQPEPGRGGGERLP